MSITHLYFVASAFLLGLGAVLSKRILSFDMEDGATPAPLVVLFLQLVGGVAVLLVMRLRNRTRTEALRHLKLPALAGLVLGIGSIGTILAIALITASEASLVFATQPIFVLILAWCLLHERVGWPVGALCLVAVMGVALTIIGGSSIAASGRALGLICAVLSTASAALYTVWMRGLSAKQDGLTALLVVQSVALVVAFLGVVGTELWVQDQALFAGRSVLLLSLVTGAIQYGAAYYLYVLGLRTTPASTAGIYLTLVPVFTIGLAFVVLGEILRPLQWIGAGVVIAAVSAVFVLSNSSLRSTKAFAS